LEDYRDNTEEMMKSSIPEKHGEDYYKETLKKLSVPSLPTLLLSFSSITISYAHMLNSFAEYAIGIFFLLLTFIAFHVLLKNNLSRKHIHHDTNIHSRSTELNQSNRVAREWGIRSRMFLLPIAIALLISLRIFTIINQSPADIGGNGIDAEISEVKQLRYRQQILLLVSSNCGIHRDAHPIRSIAYCPRDIDINRHDTIKIFSKPLILNPKNQPHSAYKTDLIRRGFSYIFYLNNTNFKKIRAASQDFKKRVRKKIERKLSLSFNEETASLLKALYFGNKNFINKSTIREFKRAGVLHVLAASGLHIGILASIPLFIMGFTRINKNLTLLITTLLLLFYLYITDMPVSLLRAFTMFFIYSIQRIFDFDKNIFNTLFLSALFILSIYPYELYSLGFQLSFSATFGILLLFNLYRRTLSFLPPILSNSLALTLSAQIFVYPIIWFHMKEVNLSGIFSNILIIPGIAITLITSITTNILSPISSTISGLMACITDYSYHCIHQFVKLISRTNSHITDYKNGFILLIPYMLIAIPLLPFLNRQRTISATIVAGYMLAFFITCDQRSNENQIVILKRNHTDIILCKRGKTANLIGDINSYEEARDIINYISSGDIDILNIFIPMINFKSIKYFTYIIKGTQVSTCNIPPNLTFAPYMREFFEIIDIDRITLKINEFPPGTPSHNYNKQLIKEIVENKNQSMSNQFRLYYLLKGANPEKLHKAINENKSISTLVTFI
jgi:ComEC/Rec2-related protein